MLRLGVKTSLTESEQDPVARPPRWRWTARKTRLLLYLLILGAVAAWKYVPRPWHPSTTLETPHHLIFSTANRVQTADTAHALELLYAAYSNRLAGLATFQRDHPKLRLQLFKDRAEFRRTYPNLGWAEAFYREPYCRAYFSAGEPNPCHWMLHESVHQLNREVAHLKLAKWLEEGLAAYFSTARLGSDALAVGNVDPYTYPVWWIDELATSPTLSENLANGSVIPLRALITNRGGPAMNQSFNLYYLHWWTLTRFLLENPRYREHAMALMQSGGGIDAFEQILGPLDQVQTEWHSYVRHLKTELSREWLAPKGRPGEGNEGRPPLPPQSH